jgi:hypothetical protein
MGVGSRVGFATNGSGWREVGGHLLQDGDGLGVLLGSEPGHDLLAEVGPLPDIASIPPFEMTAEPLSWSIRPGRRPGPAGNASLTAGAGQAYAAFYCLRKQSSSVLSGDA